MVTVAFVLDLSNNWLGGVNYYRNLLTAISRYESNSVRIKVFLPKGQEADAFHDTCVISCEMDVFLVYTKNVDENFSSRYVSGAPSPPLRRQRSLSYTIFCLVSGGKEHRMDSRFST